MSSFERVSKLLLQGAQEMNRSRDLITKIDLRVNEAIKQATQQNEFDALTRITAVEERLIQRIRSRLAISLKEVHQLRNQHLDADTNQMISLVEKSIITAQQYLDKRQLRIDVQKKCLDSKDKQHENLLYSALARESRQTTRLKNDFVKFQERMIKEYQTVQHPVAGASALVGMMAPAGLGSDGTTFWFSAVMTVLGWSCAIIVFAHYDNKIRAVHGDKKAQDILSRKKGRRLAEIRALFSNMARFQ